MKERIKKRLEEMGFDLTDFDFEYECAIDNYNQEFHTTNAEKNSDFEIYCIDNWS